MTLQAGQSDGQDSVVVTLPDAGISLTSIESFTLNSSVLVPTDSLTLTVLPDDPNTSNLLLPGVKIQVKVNDKPQFTGYIDKRSVKTSRSGTMVTITARDILSPLVDSNIDPKLKFTDTQTLADVIVSVLATYGISTVYNDGSVNVNLQTGVVQKPTQTATTTSVQIQTQTLDASGKIDSAFATRTGTIRSSPKKTNLKSLTLAQLKPHEGEGTHQLIDRLLKRFGLRWCAAADGSGVIVDPPDFTTPPTQTIRNSVTDSAGNNVLDGDATYDLGAQPSCIVARGVGGLGADLPSTTLRVIGINEIAGTDENGTPLAQVQAILAAYKDAKVLTIRPQLNAFRKSYADALIARPMFVKDDESRTIDQLSAFVRRELAVRQHKALVVKYSLMGLSDGGKPWAPNTMVSVADTVLDLNLPLYCFEREFSKNRQGGTTTKLSLCLPYSLDFAV